MGAENLAPTGFRTVERPACSLQFITTALRFQIVSLSKISQDKLWLTRFQLTQNCFRKIDFPFGMERVLDAGQAQNLYPPPTNKSH